MKECIISESISVYERDGKFYERKEQVEFSLIMWRLKKSSDSWGQNVNLTKVSYENGCLFLACFLDKGPLVSWNCGLRYIR
ncbi:hypothetical protein BH10BAC1_BH10BAC1_05650 [soil metagenome]